MRKKEKGGGREEKKKRKKPKQNEVVGSPPVPRASAGEGPSLFHPHAVWQAANQTPHSRELKTGLMTKSI